MASISREQLTIRKANLYEGSARQMGTLHASRARAWRIRCRLLGTSADISAQLCHSVLRLQAAFLVMFPHSDWTMVPQMISLLIALT
jgi:hypothetical protein